MKEEEVISGAARGTLYHKVLEEMNLFEMESMDQIAAKRDFPNSGSPLYYEGMFTGFYFVVFKSYLAFYKVEGDRMLVSRVVYGKSDYMRTLFRNAHK